MKTRIGLMVVALVLGIAATPASAQVDMFLEIPGVDGEATSSGYEDQIEVIAWSFGGSTPGCGNNPSYQDLAVTKYVDLSSVDLWSAVDNGTIFPTATLRVVDLPTGIVTKQLTLSNVGVTSIATGGSGGENRLTENISLLYSQVVITYRQTSGKSGATETVTITLPGCPGP